MNTNIYDNKKVITVLFGDLSTYSDKKYLVDYDYLFLNNDFICNFNDENGGIWKSVTHYISAKKFEGTQYEEEIKNCKTGIVAKLKAKEINYPYITFTSKGIVTRDNKIVGSNKFITKNNKDANESNFSKVESKTSKSNDNKNLRVALKLKFDGDLYNSLVNTRPHLVVSRPNPLLGNILMKMRDEKDLR